jgi:hypothetical protein
MCEAMMLGNSSRGATVSTQSCLALVAHRIIDNTLVYGKALAFSK